MVAVAYGEEQGRRAGEVVFGHLGLGGAQAGEGVGHGVDLLFGQAVALDMAAVLHQIEIIDHVHGVRRSGEGFDDGLLRVVDEEHDVRQLNGGVAADPGPGRDALLDGGLGGTDEGAAAGGEVVGVQVHHPHQAVADAAVGLLALHIDEGGGQRLKDALIQIVRHGGVDVGDELVHIGGLQIGLRQNEAQRGGGVAHLLLHRLPVLRLGGELIAGHHGPLGHILPLGQQNVGGIKTQLVEFRFHLPFLLVPMGWPGAIAYFTIYQIIQRFATPFCEKPPWQVAKLPGIRRRNPGQNRDSIHARRYHNENTG